MQAWERYASVVGRALLALIFLLSGVGKIFDWSGTAGYMAAKGMPLIPLFLIGAIAVEVLGGLSVLLGWKARWGALALCLFLVPTTLIFHNFWAFADAERRVQMIMFLKNLAIMGGLLQLASRGAGPLSLDREA